MRIGDFETKTNDNWKYMGIFIITSLTFLFIWGLFSALTGTLLTRTLLNAPRLFLGIDVNMSVTEEAGDAFLDWGEAGQRESSEVQASAEDKVSTYGKTVADFIGDMYIAIAVMIAIGLALIGFARGGIPGIIIGAGLGTLLGVSIWGMWWHLNQGHVVPYVICVVTYIIMRRVGAGGFGFFSFLAMCVVMFFWVLLMPDTWGAVNILDFFQVDSWDALWTSRDFIWDDVWEGFGQEPLI